MIMMLLLQVGVTQPICTNELSRIEDTATMAAYAETVRCLVQELSKLRSVVDDLLPKESVIAFAGREADLPTGWSICDGSDGRPSLANRFVLGTDLARQVGQLGGDSTHVHRASLQQSSVLGPMVPISVAAGRMTATSDHRHDVELQRGRHVPPFIKLMYVCNGP